MNGFKWLAEEAVADWEHRDLEGEDYLRACAQALCTPLSVDELQRLPVDRLIWNLQACLDIAIWVSNAPLDLKRACIAALPQFFERAAPYIGQNGSSLWMFWDGLLDIADFDRVPDLKQAVANALREMLESSERACQLSALHGLSHFDSDDALIIVRAFRERPSIDHVLAQIADDVLAGNEL